MVQVLHDGELMPHRGACMHGAGAVAAGPRGVSPGPVLTRRRCNVTTTAGRRRRRGGAARHAHGGRLGACLYTRRSSAERCREVPHAAVRWRSARRNVTLTQCGEPLPLRLPASMHESARRPPLPRLLPVVPAGAGEC